MIIANPMYDSVFKYLMEDNVVAKGLIARIIGEDIVELVPSPQEETISSIASQFSYLGIKHQDYVATIRNKKGETHKVAIEVQKSYIAPKIATFRTYIAEKYKKPTTISAKDTYLPLKTIYFIEETFNANLPATLKVGRDYIDFSNGKNYTGEEDSFVSQMTHEAYFIQTELVSPDLKNDIARVLNFFTTRFQMQIPKGETLDPEEKRKIARKLNIPDSVADKIDDKLFGRMQTRLFGADNNPEVQLNVELAQKYEDQQEAERIRIDNQLKEDAITLKQNKKALAHKDQALKHKDQALKQKDQVLKHKDQVLKQKDQVLKQKDQALEQKNEALINSARALLKAGLSIEQVQMSTGLPLATIKGL